jgi:alpha-tubulin suppressor-like RCC1 family protein
LNVTNVSDFSVGQVNAAAIANGQLWAWGADAATPFLNPRRLGNFDGFTHVSLGDWHGLLIGADHRVYVWGGRSYGALGDGITSGRSQSPDFLAD